MLEDAAFAVLVGMPELALGTVRHHLDLTVRMQGPDGARRERVIVEDPQGAEMGVLGIVVVAEGEVPAALERPILDPPPGLVDLLGFANGDHRRPPGIQIPSSHSPARPMQHTDRHGPANKENHALEYGLLMMRDRPIKEVTANL